MTLIRRAKLSDSEPVGTCLLLAMEDIVYKFIGEEDPTKAKAFMLYFVEKENNQYSWQNCWVAEDERKVVAAINLYDGARLSKLRQPIIDYLKNQFDRNLKLEDETQAGEYYLDALGVKPDQQGKGIGTQLLQFIIDEYVQRNHQTIGLLVDEVNTNAKKLYLELGFKSVEWKVFLGKNMDHLQITAV